MRRKVLVHKIKITYLMVLDNFAFMKKMRYFITRMCVCPSVRLSVCPSVRLSVCPSVRLSPLESAITFERVCRSAPNFQGRPNSSQVIFGRVTRNPDFSGSGPDPEKWVLRQIYLLRGFRAGGVVLHLFGNGRTGPTKCWERNFDFLPYAGKNGPGNPGRPGWRQKCWNFDFFHKRDPC